MRVAPTPGTSSRGRCADGLGSLCPVGADREAVRLVAEPLDEIEHGVPAFERKGPRADPVELFLAQIAVDAFGDAHHGDVLDAKLGHDLMHSRDLPLAAVDQEEIRPSASLPVGILLQQPLEAPGQDLLHHAEIVAGRERLVPDVEFPVLRFHEPLGACDDHRTHGVGTLDVGIVVDLDPLWRAVEPEGV